MTVSGLPVESLRPAPVHRPPVRLSRLTEAHRHRRCRGGSWTRSSTSCSPSNSTGLQGRCSRRSEVGRAGRPTGASGAPPPARPQQAAHLDVTPGQLLDRSASDEAHDTQRLAAGRTRPPRARRPHRACVSWVIRTVTIAGSAPCSRYRRLLAPLRSRHAETARGARSVGLVADYGLH